jgi:hypothetical protein
MYGSATAGMSIADWQRVISPAFSSVFWSARPLMTVASMPM